MLQSMSSGRTPGLPIAVFLALLGSSCRPAVSGGGALCSPDLGAGAPAFESAEALTGPLLLLRAVPQAATASFSACARPDLKVINGAAQGFLSQPYAMSSAFTPPFVADARGVALAGDETGAKPLSVDNFLLVEAFDAAGARTNSLFSGQTGGSPIALDGHQIERYGAEGFQVGPLLLSEGEGVRSKVPVRLRVTMLDYGAIGSASDVYVVPPPGSDVTNGITVRSATYGANCDVPAGNATRFVSWNCDGRTRCAYRVDYEIIGDPARGCAKDFQVEWQCGADPVVRKGSLHPEAGFGSMLTLECR